MWCLVMIQMQELVASGLALSCRMMGDACVVSLTVVLVRLASFTALYSTYMSRRKCLCVFLSSGWIVSLPNRFLGTECDCVGDCLGRLLPETQENIPTLCFFPTCVSEVVRR